MRFLFSPPPYCGINVTQITFSVAVMHTVFVDPVKSAATNSIQVNVNVLSFSAAYCTLRKTNKQTNKMLVTRCLKPSREQKIISGLSRCSWQIVVLSRTGRGRRGGGERSLQSDGFNRHRKPSMLSSYRMLPGRFLFQRFGGSITERSSSRPFFVVVVVVVVVKTARNAVLTAKKNANSQHTGTESSTANGAVPCKHR